MRNTALRVLFLLFALAFSGPGRADVLYNGVQLPKPWPPTGATTYEPMEVPYLKSPPKVIPIGVGRQLFVDNFLIKETTLKRTFHHATYYAQNPVLRPDKPWETNTQDTTAMVFSDGVWYDPQDRLFKMWYMGGYLRATSYAVSKDGITWEKPSLDVKPETNVVLDAAGKANKRDSSTVWLDLAEKDPQKRFKLFIVRIGKGGWTGFLYTSPDGIHWGEPVADTGPLGGDRSTIFYNPFRKVWVYSIRSHIPIDPRWRKYREHADLIEGVRQVTAHAVFWIGADKHDPPRPELKTHPELYNLDAVAYESLLLGLFSIWPGQPKDRPKPNDVCLGYSRDGFHWDRPDHRPFANVSERATATGTGGTCNRPAAAAWSWAKSFTFT